MSVIVHRGRTSEFSSAGFADVRTRRRPRPIDHMRLASVAKAHSGAVSLAYGHTGSFPGYRILAAASADGRRSVVFSVNAQIVPGRGSTRVSNMIRSAQERAVCRALRGS